MTNSDKLLGVCGIGLTGTASPVFVVRGGITLKKKELELISFLEKYPEKWISANQLAEFDQCTTRTIRNRIASINQTQPNTILTSSNGYQLNATATTQLTTNTTGDRKAKILTALLKKSHEGIDLFELADLLFISESTLKSDINQLKKSIEKEHLKITIKDDLVKLAGTERDKRRFMIALLYDESSIQETLKGSIQQMIGYISLDDLKRNIREVLAEHDLRINQYSMDNIVLHYAISIERIRQGHVLKSLEKAQEIYSEDYLLATKIASRLEAEYAIQFSEGELQQLSMLFIGVQNETKRMTCELDQVVDSKIITALKEILAQVRETYLIDLEMDSEFFSKLAIHIQALYYRSKYESFARNSSLLDLKTAYPVIYDISVYISSLIQEKLGIWFNEDEIAFIALHIGAFINEKKDESLKIKLVLIKANYHDLTDKIISEINHEMGDKVTIIAIDEWQLKEAKYDLLLTTDRSIASKYSGSVFVNPFLTSRDLQKIEKRLGMVQLQKQQKLMYGYIEKFIPEVLFYNQLDSSELTPTAIRQQLFTNLKQRGYVGTDFLASVEKRESLSPTSFPSGIAVPHAIDLQAKKSGISIITLQEEILWANCLVKLVAFVTISQEEAKEFNSFFEKFIEIVSDSVNTQQLSNAVDYDDFILKLKTMVTDYE